MEVIGYIGATLLAMCALPQAVMSLRQGHSKGLSLMFLWTWYLGEILMVTFIWDKVDYNSPLFVNYAFNVFLLSMILYYKHFPRSIK